MGLVRGKTLNSSFYFQNGKARRDGTWLRLRRMTGLRLYELQFAVLCEFPAPVFQLLREQIQRNGHVGKGGVRFVELHCERHGSSFRNAP